jgi:hypothetical protein
MPRITTTRQYSTLTRRSVSGDGETRQVITRSIRELSARISGVRILRPTTSGGTSPCGLSRKGEIPGTTSDFDHMVMIYTTFTKENADYIVNSNIGDYRGFQAYCENREVRSWSLELSDYFEQVFRVLVLVHISSPEGSYISSAIISHTDALDTVTWGEPAPKTRQDVGPLWHGLQMTHYFSCITPYVSTLIFNSCRSLNRTDRWLINCGPIGNTSTRRTAGRTWKAPLRRSLPLNSPTSRVGVRLS